MILAAAVLALSACGQEPEGGSGAGTPPTMPEITFTATEYNDDLEVIMEATVVIAADGSWERTGTETDSGVLTTEQVERIDDLADAPDFPEDAENDMVGRPWCPITSGP
jgi:ABC-type glycerol-3-phosphate transport system substrate-binding protein